MDYQPTNTYIVKYSYPDYHFESEVGVFCDYDPNGTPPSEDTLKKFFDDGDEPDIVDIIGACSNNFDGANLLSREAIEIINGGYRKKLASRQPPSIELLCVEDWEDKKIFLSYIQFVYQQLPHDEKTRHDYQQRIIKAIRESIVCYAYQIDRKAVERILEIFGEKLTDDSIPRQLRKLLDKERERERRYAILCKLALVENVPILRDRLAELNKKYHITYEDNQRKLACIFHKFLETYPHLLPSVQGKLSTGIKLLSDYFGIDAPTFRARDIQNYIDDDAFAIVKANPKLKNKTKSLTYVDCLPLIDKTFWEGLAHC